MRRKQSERYVIPYQATASSYGLGLSIRMAMGMAWALVCVRSSLVALAMAVREMQDFTMIIWVIMGTSRELSILSIKGFLTS